MIGWNHQRLLYGPRWRTNRIIRSANIFTRETEDERVTVPKTLELIGKAIRDNLENIQIRDDALEREEAWRR